MADTKKYSGLGKLPKKESPWEHSEKWEYVRPPISRYESGNPKNHDNRCFSNYEIRTRTLLPNGNFKLDWYNGKHLIALMEINKYNVLLSFTIYDRNGKNTNDILYNADDGYIVKDGDVNVKSGDKHHYPSYIKAGQKVYYNHDERLYYDPDITIHYYVQTRAKPLVAYIDSLHRARYTQKDLPIQSR